MTTESLASRLAFHPTRAAAPRYEGILAFGGDDQVFAKLNSVGVQAAMAILLSIFGLGSAMGQSIAPDTALGANTQAARDRVISEIREPREVGSMKRWSPVLVELPYKTPTRRNRFEPIVMHRHGSGNTRDLPGQRSPEYGSAASLATD